MKGEINDLSCTIYGYSEWNGYITILTSIEDIVIDARRANISAYWMDEPFVSLWQEDDEDFEHSILFTTRGITFLLDSAEEAKSLYRELQSVVRRYYDYNWFFER